MKVLFAVNNENISESIIKRYQQDYKEIISAKNVYYFNAIIKELQRDKTYDRIVISEDLEPFSNNNYDAIDKFIFDKMDNISDEATNQSGNDIPIILICADRRAKSETVLVKLFGIGVYNALIGKDRSITNVCELLNKPRTKKDAKAYYRIDSENVDYKVENEGDVSEVEIQNILNHYKKLGRNEEKYVESFDHIASQYTDSQLRLIAKFLPLNVKAVLEANSKTYQEVVSFGNVSSVNKEPQYNDYKKNSKEYKASHKQKQVKNETSSMNLDFIEKNLKQNKISEPVIIPSGINTANVKKLDMNKNSNIMPEEDVNKILDEIPNNDAPVMPEINDEIENNSEEVLTAQPKRRGRPKKVQIPEETTTTTAEVKKRGRGRPKKVVEEVKNNTSQNNINIQDANSPLNLFELGDEEENTNNNISTNNSSAYSDMILPGLEDDNEVQEEQIPEEKTSISSYNILQNDNIIQNNNLNFKQTTTELQNTGKYNLTNVDLSGLLTSDKKVVAFVGTSKNGTSFLINNIAEILSNQGIKTAILDLTQNRNAYYIYTQNDENLRSIAYKTVDNLRKGNPEGIIVNKNLTVYASLPGENQDINDYSNILETLIKNYSLVLLDCDFETIMDILKKHKKFI